jgi:cytochrome oxidase assembly protein ShyY1
MFWTPRWIASHLFAATLIVAFVIAGMWQIDRLQARQTANEAVLARESSQPVALADVPGDTPAEQEYRRVQLSGRFDAGREILIANRSDEGTPGFWAWTAFEIETGGEILVNRGFVSRAIVIGVEGAPSLASTQPTSGPVIVEGLLRQGLDGGGRLSEDGTQLSRPDSALAAEHLGVDTTVDPLLYLELDAQDPALTADFPRVIPPPDLGEGPHRSYAFQWFTFATIGVIGYGLVLRRIARGSEAKGDIGQRDL